MNDNQHVKSCNISVCENISLLTEWLMHLVIRRGYTLSKGCCLYGDLGPELQYLYKVKQDLS